MTIGIYTITAPDGRVYVGQSVNIEDRWKRYQKLQCKSQFRIYNSLQEHGAENHKFEIIKTWKHRPDKKMLDKAEIKLIDKLKKEGVTLMNVAPGGSIYYPAWKAKMRKARQRAQDLVRRQIQKQREAKC